MKKLITLTLGMLLIGTTAFPQQKVDSFEEAMTAKPIDNKINMVDIIYTDGGKLDSFQERSLRFKKPSHRSREFYKNIGKPIDEASLIDYKEDTLYMVNTSYRDVVGGGAITIKTKKGIYYVSKNIFNGTYELLSLEDRYAMSTIIDIREFECFKKSNDLIYEAIFNWDLKLLKQLISIAGGGYLDGTVMFVTRIIIRDNQVLKKYKTSEIDVPVYWRLDDSDEGYCY